MREETAVSVKSYLLQKLEKMTTASEDFVKNSEGYSALVADHGGSVEAAYKADPKQMQKLVAKLQDDYKAMDSFGYETVEGIVAGVPSLADYDIYLDAGFPASEGPEGVAPVVLVPENGEKIDKQGLYSPISSSRCFGVATSAGWCLWIAARSRRRVRRSCLPLRRTQQEAWRATC